MGNNKKLELTWIGKDKRPKLEPRILIRLIGDIIPINLT